MASINCSAAMAMRIHLFSKSMESRSRSIFITSARNVIYVTLTSPLQMNTNYALHWGANTQLSPTQSYQRLVSMNDHISDLLW